LHKEWGSITSFTKEGFNGVSACCGCGGGDRTKVLPKVLPPQNVQTSDKNAGVDDARPVAPMIKMLAGVFIGAGLIGFGCWCRFRGSEPNGLDTEATKYGKASVDDI